MLLHDHSWFHEFAYFGLIWVTMIWVVLYLGSPLTNCVLKRFLLTHWTSASKWTSMTWGDQDGGNVWNYLLCGSDQRVFCIFVARRCWTLPCGAKIQYKIVAPSSQQRDDDGCILIIYVSLKQTAAWKSILHLFLGSRNLTGVSCELFVWRGASIRILCLIPIDKQMFQVGQLKLWSYLRYWMNCDLQF